MDGLGVTTRVTTTVLPVSGRVAGVVSLVISTVLFAASYTLTKVALIDLPPITLGMLRFVLAGLVIGGLLGVTAHAPQPQEAG